MGAQPLMAKTSSTNGVAADVSESAAAEYQFRNAFTTLKLPAKAVGPSGRACTGLLRST